MSNKLFFVTCLFFLLGLVLASTTSAADPNMLAWYRFDETDPCDPNAYDSSGNDYHGTVVGSLDDYSWTTGYIDGAIDLNGLDGYVQVPIEVFAGLSKKVSVALWDYGDPNRNLDIYDSFYSNVGAGDDTLFSHLIIDERGVLIDWCLLTAAGYESAASVVEDPNTLEGQWNNWIYTKDATAGANGEMKIYRNGQLWAFTDEAPGNIKPINDFQIGTGIDGPFDGKIDEFAIWDKALTDAEVFVIYNYGLGAPAAFAWDPNPADGAEQVDPRGILSWKVPPDVNNPTYIVYLGPDSNFTGESPVAFGLTEPNYDPDPDLDYVTRYYWRVDVNDPNGGGDPILWEGGVWSFTTAGQAWNPSPADGAEDVSLDVVLAWSPGIDANSHDVYFGTSFDDVNDANTSDTSGVYRGNQSLESNSYDPLEALTLAKTYYWRIDEVNDPSLWIGDVWQFTTTTHLNVDDFDSYADVDALRLVWPDYATADTKAEIFLETTIVQDGNSLRFNYYNDVVGSDRRKYSEIEALASNLEVGTDWTVGGAKAVVLDFRGLATNSAQPLYLAVEDSTANVAVATYDDVNATLETQWQQWNIDFDGAGVDLTNVYKVYLGVGVRGEVIPSGGSGGGMGDVYFDEIEIRPSRCRPELVLTDFTSNCITDEEDLAIMASDWLLTDYTVVPSPPTRDPCAWYKLDDASGTIATDSSGNGYNATISGAAWVNDPCRGWCLDFGGSDAVLVPLGAFSSVNTEITITLWTYGASSLPTDHDTFYSNVSEGDDELYAHIPWGNEEILWYTYAGGVYENAGGPAEPNEYKGQWNHYALTKNSDTGQMKIYINGLLWESSSGTTTPIGAITDFQIGFGIDGGYEGLIDDFRIYDYELAHSEILSLVGGQLYVPLDSPANLYDQEPPLQKKVNFNDYAIFADSWLDETLWP